MIQVSERWLELLIFSVGSPIHYLWIARLECEADVVEGEVVGLEREEDGRPVGQRHREILRTARLLVARRSQHSLLINQIILRL